MLFIYLLALCLSIFWLACAKAIYLTNSSTQHFSSEYVSLDQCTRRGPKQEQYNAFALKFQLTGRCENGLLICYPGTLDPSGANSAFGMAPEIQFQVPNHPQSRVAQHCLTHQKQCGSKEHCYANQVWHGINVSAPAQLDRANGRRGILLELSITNQTYTLDVDRDGIFIIKFGSHYDLITRATVDEKGSQIIFADDDVLWEAYSMRKRNNDASLSNYASLWMLGLDLLPMSNRDKMQLHVYRDCGCEMHAWFLHPTDVLPMRRFGHPVVSADCPATIVDGAAEQFALAKPFSRDRAIRLRQRLNKNPTKMVVRLGNAQKQQMLEMKIDQPPYGLIDIKSMQAGVYNQDFEDNAAKTLVRERLFKSIGDDDDDADGGGSWAAAVEEDQQTGSAEAAVLEVEEEEDDNAKDKYLDVELVARNYFYEVKVGDRKAFNYFPKAADWLTEGKMEDITRVEVIGDIYPNSVDVPEVDDRPNPSIKQVNSSYVSRFERTLDQGDQVVIKGQMSAKAERLDRGITLLIGLLHNSPGFNEHVSVMTWYMRQTHGNLTMGQYNPKDKFFGATDTKMDLFKEGEPFEMTINIGQLEGTSFLNFTLLSYLIFTITVKTPNRTSQTNFTVYENSFRDINYITVLGEVELFADPIILNEANDFDLDSRLSWEVFPLLSVGDSIIVQGQLAPNATSFKIDLLHDVNKKNPYIGDLVLQVLFDFTDGNGKILMNTWIHEIADALNSTEHWFPSTLFPGEEFKIEIRVAYEMYQVYIHGALAANFTHLLPSWSVDYITIGGDCDHFKKFYVNRTYGIFRHPSNRSLAMPYIFEVPAKKLVDSRDMLQISGKVTKENGTISVLLLNEAIETYESVPKSVIEFKKRNGLSAIGKIVSRADFFTDSAGIGRVNLSYLSINDSYAGKQSYQLEPTPLTLDDDFMLKIFFKDSFQYKLKNYGMFVYEKGEMPAWAIQYIRIEGDLALDQEPSFEVNDLTLESFRTLFG